MIITTPRAPAANSVTPPSGPSPLARTDEQRAAFTQLQDLARPLRARVRADPEGFPITPGRLGAIEFQCDGQDCHGCPVPGPLLAVWTDRPRLFPKLWAIPGVRRHQTGDHEMRAVFPATPEILVAVAGVIRARRRARRPMTPERLAQLTEGRRQKALGAPMSTTSRSQDRSGGTRASHSPSRGLSTPIPAG